MITPAGSFLPSFSSRFLLSSCLALCLLLCPLLATSLVSTPIEQSTFLWLTTSNATVGRSANPGSPYLVLSLPLVIPAARAYLFLTNLSPHPITLEWNDVVLNHTAPLPTGQMGGFNVDNCSVSLRHSYAVWVGGRRVVADTVSNLCVDCVLNITFTADNRTSVPSIQQPTYALQYKDRDDGTTYTSDFVSPFYPTSDHPVHVDGQVPSLVLNFTFIIPILSFNFFPNSILRLLPSSSSVTTPTSHYPAVTSPSQHTYIPPLLHIPYYYTDILNPSGTFESGVVLTVIGGFSINHLDLYCCYISNANSGYYSDCKSTNSSDTFHCTIPKSVDDKGYDGELFTVVGEYQPAKAGWASKGYYMKHLVPAGDDDDNTFAVDKAVVPLAWYDIRGWTMRIIIIAGGLLLIALSIMVFVMAWRRWRERKQRKEMEQRAAEEGEAGEDSDHWDADAPYLNLDSSINSSLLDPSSDAFNVTIHPSPVSPSFILPHEQHGAVPSPISSMSALATPGLGSLMNDARLSPIKVKVKNGRRQVRAAAGGSKRQQADMHEPLLYGTSI